MLWEAIERKKHWTSPEIRVRSAAQLNFLSKFGRMSLFQNDLHVSKHISRAPCFWKKLWPKWTKINNSINFLPNIKSDVRFFFLHNVDYGTAKKNAKFYSFGTFLGPKRLKNDEKWLNFAFHFSDDLVSIFRGESLSRTRPDSHSVRHVLVVLHVKSTIMSR